MKKTCKNKKKIIILGASGYIGKRLITILNEDKDILNNYQLILFNKNKRKLQNLKHKYQNVVFSDIDISNKNYKRLLKTFQDAEVIYNLVHIANEKNFIQKEKEFNELIGKVAEEANVKQIVFLGGLGNKNKKLSKHLYSRIESGNILRKYKTPVTEFKVGLIIGAGNLAFEILQRLAAFLPFIIRPTNENKMTPAFIDNVINYLYKAFKYQEIFKDKILEIGQGEYYYSELLIEMKKIFDNNSNIKIVSIPDFAYNFIISKKIIPYLMAIITGHDYRLLKNTVDLVLYDTTRREKYKIENQIPKEYLEPEMDLKKMLMKALERIKKGEYKSFWDYPTILSKLSKRNNLELKDNYVIKETFDIVEKKYVNTLWEEIKNISCFIKEECWAKNIIWQFRGFINKITGGFNYKDHHRKDVSELKVGDILGYWQVDNIVETEDLKELRLIALLNSPGKEYIQFIIKKLDEEDYVLIIRNIYLLENFMSYIHFYLWYPLYNNVLENIKSKLLHYTKNRYIKEKLLLKY